MRYQHLDIEADVHVGKRALPTLLNATINTLEVYTHVHRSAQLSSLVWSLNKLDVKISGALILNLGRTMDFTEILKGLIKKTEGYENIFVS